MKILLVRLTALGDILHVLPSLHALRSRYPHATVHWLVEPIGAELLGMIDEIDKVIVLPRKQWQTRLKRLDRTVPGEATRFFQNLRSERYDLAIDFQGNFRSGLATYLSGAPARVGFSRKLSKEMNGLFTNRRVTPLREGRHKIARNLALVKSLDARAEPEGVCLPVDEATATRINGFLNPTPSPGPLVILHPGTSRFGAFKQWPEENYVILGKQLAAEVGARLVVTWGPGEEELARRIAEAIGPSAIPSLQTSLLDLVELIRAGDLLISGDTGPMNIAPLVDTPSVSLFGPKDPAIYAPPWEKARVVAKEIPCRPCGLRKCATVWCMKWITPEEVLRPALELLTP